MLLIVEVILTVVAWKRGWGAKALRPLAVAIGGGFVLALLFGGASIGLLILLDLVAVVSLAIMAIGAPERADALDGSTGGTSRAATYRSPAVPRSLSRYGAYESAAPRS